MKEIDASVETVDTMELTPNEIKASFWQMGLI